MSAETADHVVAKLTANRIDAEKLIAVVEQATTPLQNVYTSNLYEFAEKLGDRTFKSPSLLIIGKVVQLQEQFKWLHNDETSAEYFTPVNNDQVLFNKAERA
jgi:uroporphyrin-III C-methyltransferase/precorrin-2 dehydrogenase/sirohydrochlorin ferrochelatase/uroporphyrin-III C-methyltransferase